MIVAKYLNVSIKVLLEGWIGVWVLTLRLDVLRVTILYLANDIRLGVSCSVPIFPSFKSCEIDSTLLVTINVFELIQITSWLGAWLVARLGSTLL